MTQTDHDIRTIWESMTDAFYALDARWRFTYVNAQGERLLQRAREDLLGKSVWDEFPETVYSPLHSLYHKAVADRVTVEVEFFYPPLATWFEVHAYPSEIGLAVYFRDIGDRKAAEANERQSRQFLQSILDAVSSHIAVLDDKGVIIAVNQAWRRFAARSQDLGRSCGVGDNYLESCETGANGQPGEAKVIANAMREIMAGKRQEFQHEYPCRTEEGTQWFNVRVAPFDDASPVRVVVTHEDITEIKQTAQALRRSQDLYDTLTGNFPNGSVYLFDPEMRILLVGGRGLAALGIDPKAVVGRTLHDVFGGDPIYEMLERTFLNSLEGREVTVETPIRGHWRLLRAVPIRDESGKVTAVMAMTQDITERKRAEMAHIELSQQLEYQHRRLNGILQNVPGIVWENSIDPQTGEQRVIYINDYVRVMLGYEPEEWLHTPNFWFSIVHPDDQAGLSSQIEQSTPDRQGDVIQCRMIAKDGHPVWVETHTATVRNEKGEVIGLRGVTMDITQRINAQEEQSRLAAVLQATEDMVAWMDTEGCCQYLNPAGRAMLQLEPNEPVEGCHISEFNAPWAQAITVETALPVAARNGSWTGESALISRSGREIDISQVITAHKDAAGNLLFYSTVAHDISQRKAAELALQQYSEELEDRVERRTQELAAINRALQEQILERQLAMGALQEAVTAHQQAREEADQANLAKSEFLSRMSHELRTPLNAILGFGQILSMDKDMSPRRQEGVQHILKAGQHLLHLINEVLDISRIEAGNLSLSLEPVPVGWLMEEVLDLMRPLATPNQIQFINDVQPDAELYMAADRQRLKQVLLNIVSNAVKYNRHGGSVRISATHVTELHIVRLCVKDTGMGLDEHDLKRLFTPFERLGAAKTTVEGTGIGLVLSKRLLEAMSGRIGVDSTPGVGTTFWIELPSAESPLENARHLRETGMEEEVNGSHLQAPAHTILYIEDNLPNLELIEMLLEDRKDIRLLSAMQGSTGLDIALEQSPALILLDLHLPDINGDEVLRRLRANPATKDTPVIIISADATAGQVERLLAAGATQYLTKPLNVRYFMRVLRETLGENVNDE